MRRPLQRRVRVPLRWLVLCIVAWLMLHGAQGTTQGLWREDEQRMRVGLKVFPACLGALEPLDLYLTPDGSLLVLVVHEGARSAALQAAASFESVAMIRDHPLRVKILSAADLDGYAGERLGGIFVASVGLDMGRLRAWSERHRTLVFSPFAGAVEGGAVAGLYVADRVLPFVNRAQARRAGVGFKSFFLEVARTHEGD